MVCFSSLDMAVFPAERVAGSKLVVTIFCGIMVLVLPWQSILAAIPAGEYIEPRTRIHRLSSFATALRLWELDATVVRSTFMDEYWRLGSEPHHF